MPGSQTTPGPASTRNSALAGFAFREVNNVGTRFPNAFAARWLAYMLPCRRFADVLTDACARLGADVDRYSFIAVDSHHILLAGLPAHSLALRPAHSRSHQIRDPLIEGFSHFVTSMPAPVASGWSDRRVGLAPTGKKRRLVSRRTWIPVLRGQALGQHGCADPDPPALTPERGKFEPLRHW